MRKYKSGWMMAVIMLIALLVFALVPVYASGVYPLPTAGKADIGANYLVVITHEDLTTSTTNTAQTLTNALPVKAKQSVELVACMLKTAFSDDATNAFNGLTVTVGDGTDADLFLASTELNVYSNEVWLKQGRTGWDGAGTTAFVTGVVDSTTALVYMTNVTVTTETWSGTNVVLTVSPLYGTTTVVTATSASTANGLNATGVGRKLYTATDNVDFVFTPSPVNYALSALDNGEIWFYFRILDAN